MKDIEILSGDDGVPEVVVGLPSLVVDISLGSPCMVGNTDEQAQLRGAATLVRIEKAIAVAQISITYDGQTAMAVAIASQRR